PAAYTTSSTASESSARNIGQSRSLLSRDGKAKGRRKKEEGRRQKAEGKNFPDSLAFRLFCNSKHDFSARVMRRGLLLRGDRFTQRQNLRHDWLDFSRVDQARNLREVCCIRMNRDCRTMNTPLLELGPIGERD